MRRKHREYSLETLAHECEPCQMTFRTGIEWEIHELKFHGLNEKTLHYETNTVPTIIPDDFQILFGAPEVVVKDNKFSCSY